MKVKVCGVQDIPALRAAVESGADFIGLMFAKSKRQISLTEAKRLATYVPLSVRKVGVFVNPHLNEVLTAIQEVGLQYVQLHGEEPPSFCKEIPVPVIKAFQVKQKEDLERASAYEVDYYLFDSAGGKYRGGSGLTFDWKLLEAIKIPKEKIILAGGLNPSNIKAAIEEVNPAVVDVSSGVETNGAKDPAKINDFVKRAKEHG